MNLDLNWRSAEFNDDFFGAAPSPAWTVVGGANKGTLTIDPTGHYGVGRLQSGATGNFANDLTIANLGARQLLADNPGGSFLLKARLKLSSITDTYLFFGVTDDVATSEAPISSAASADTLASAATDAAGFMFDVSMATDNWWLAGVANDVDATPQNLGSAPVANQFATFGVSVDIFGAATFYYNGNRVGSRMTGAVATGRTLSPVIAISKRSGASSASVYIDRVYARITRRPDGASN